MRDYYMRQWSAESPSGMPRDDGGGDGPVSNSSHVWRLRVGMQALARTKEETLGILSRMRTGTLTGPTVHESRTLCTMFCSLYICCGTTCQSAID